MTVETGRADQRDIDALLQHLDHPVPVVEVSDIVARAGRQSRRWKLAAGVLLALAGAGGAYALPGSPLRRWIQSAGDRTRTELSAPSPSPTPSPQAQATPGVPAGAGIAVNPGRSLVIQFTAAQPRSEARVSLVDSALVVVQSSSSAVRFTSDLDRLRIDNTNAAGQFEIRIPQAADRVEIRVGDTSVFLKAGSRIATRGNRLPEGSWVIPLHQTAQSR